MSPLTNKLIGNIQKTTNDFVSENFIDSDNVVVIDTQNNRIGINTKDPSCSIHIVENSISESGKIICNTISCDNILCDTIKINNISYATVKNDNLSNTFSTISYDNADVSYINITLESNNNKNIIIETSYINIYNDDVSNNIYEINSNVSVKYISDIMYGYIEYDFIIYNISGANIQEINSNNNIVSTKNSINFPEINEPYYSTSHLNYIGTISHDNIFFIITISNNNFNNINNLTIDNLNTTIRLLN